MLLNSKKKMITQKCQIVAILLFSALFSLFFSSISLAAYDQTQDQNNIMRHLINGAPSCRLSKTDIKEFQESEGHCLGFSAMWLYAKWLQVVRPDIAKIYNGDLYKSTITDILGTWSNCADIKDFALLVKRLQNSQKLGTFEKEINQLYTDGKKLKKEYSVASLLTLKQLKQLLKENIIHDHRLILIISHNHATALFKNGDKYYYFNPNYTEGEIECSSIDHVAELIFYHNLFEDAKPSPLALEIFSFDGKSPIYPSQQEILERINPSLINESGYTGLLLAAYTGCLESARYFLNKKVDIEQVDTEYQTALMLAAQNGHLEVTRLLLEKRAEINKAENNGRTALMLAAQVGHLEVVRLLLEKGADINKTNSEGWTALILAAENGHLEVVQLLLKKGAESDETQNNDRTALIQAAQNGHFEVVCLLLENGVNINRADSKGWTALILTAKNV